MKRGLLVGVVVLALAGQAEAATIIETDSTRPYQAWVDAALVPTPDATIRVVTDAARCSEDGDPSLGCTDGYTTIWIQPWVGRGTFLHELGHVFDRRELTDTERATLLGVFRQPEWWSNGDNWQDGQEWFADAYSRCATDTRIHRRKQYGMGGGRLRGWRLIRACDLIRAT